jgi:hypothetical protein
MPEELEGAPKFIVGRWGREKKNSIEGARYGKRWEFAEILEGDTGLINI